MTRDSATNIRPGRFQLHGLEVEVEPAPDGTGWHARVVSPAAGPDWHNGRRAWDAIDAAAFAHLAAAPVDETYRRLAGEPRFEPMTAAPLVAA